MRGTSSSSEGPSSADVHLVAYGLGKETTVFQLSQWLKGKGLDIRNCECLTKFEGARSLTFKIIIRASDYEKATDPSIWPARVGLRKFKFFTKRNDNRLNELHNTGNQKYPVKSNSKKSYLQGDRGLIKPPAGIVNKLQSNLKYREQQDGLRVPLDHIRDNNNVQAESTYGNPMLRNMYPHSQNGQFSYSPWNTNSMDLPVSENYRKEYPSLQRNGRVSFDENQNSVYRYL